MVSSRCIHSIFRFLYIPKSKNNWQNRFLGEKCNFWRKNTDIFNYCTSMSHFFYQWLQWKFPATGNSILYVFSETNEFLVVSTGYRTTICTFISVVKISWKNSRYWTNLTLCKKTHIMWHKHTPMVEFIFSPQNINMLEVFEHGTSNLRRFGVS